MTQFLCQPIHHRLRHRLVAFAFCSIVVLIAQVGQTSIVQAESPARPNILLILADDLGFSDLGCYGGEIQTPNLDSLAANGLRYSQFYNTGRCWPTRGSLLTGYYAQSIRRDKLPSVPKSGNRGRRPKWAELVTRPLSASGYRCYHTGKWHIDGMPIENGFDRSYYLLDQSRFFNPEKHYLDDVQLPPVKKGTTFYSTNRLAEHATEVLTEHAREHADAPFFHYLAFAAPHFPLHALPEDIALYHDQYNVGWEVIRNRRFNRQKELGLFDVGTTANLSPVERDLGPPYDFPKAIVELGPGESNRPVPWMDLTEVQQEFQATKMAIHAAMIHRMDIAIGRVFETIRSMGQWDNTIVMFLSDNGASAEIMVRADGHDRAADMGSAESYLCLGPGWSTVSNTPFRRHKTWTHEGGISTPFLVSWPQGIQARGEVRHQPRHVIDVTATLLELSGAKPVAERPTSPGMSLVADFTGGANSAGGADSANGSNDTHEILWWFHDGHKAVRVGNFKAVSPAGEPWELYDLSVDRSESNDLANAKPKQLQRLIKAWEQQAETCRQRASTP